MRIEFELYFFAIYVEDTFGNILNIVGDILQPFSEVVYQVFDLFQGAFFPFKFGMIPSVEKIINASTFLVSVSHVFSCCFKVSLDFLEDLASDFNVFFGGRDDSLHVGNMLSCLCVFYVGLEHVVSNDPRCTLHHDDHII